MMPEKMDSPLSRCRLCPRRCSVDRTAGKRGFCNSGSKLRIFRWGPHFGEEPPITGRNGAGTVFFSNCTLNCLYCQNHKWSQQGGGTDFSAEKLAEIFLDLKKKGCHNWDLVSPTPWLPLIEEARLLLSSSDKMLPFVYNSSGFESLETLERYKNLADIALVDLRYSSGGLSRLASGAQDYPAVARNALKWFYSNLGPLETDSAGVALKGVICRILVLPGHADEAVESLRWIADAIGTDVHVSIMSQYTPAWKAPGNGNWGRKITEDEYSYVTDEADSLGFENGWIQPFGAADDDSLLGCEMAPGEGESGHKQQEVEE